VSPSSTPRDVGGTFTKGGAHGSSIEAEPNDVQGRFAASEQRRYTTD
jgi:hypothetical protein